MRTKPSEQRGAFTKTAAEFFVFFSTDINECRISVSAECGDSSRFSLMYKTFNSHDMYVSEVLLC